MKTISKMAAVMLATTLAMMLGGCSVAGGEGEAEAEPENVASTEQAVINDGTGPATKTKSGLLADGYTCTTMEGTTVTLCWKNGSPGYTCNDRGTCTQNLVKGPIRPGPYLPIGGGGVLSP